MKNRKIFSLIIFSLIVFSCKKTQEEKTFTKTEQSQIEITKKIYSEQILPINDSVLLELNLLKNSFELYCTDSLQNPKSAVKDQWLKTAKTIERAKLFNITQVTRALYFDKLYDAPLAETMILNLETNYKNATNVNIVPLALNQKGMVLLECLLFQTNDLPAYKTLFRAATDDLIQTQNQLIDYWKTELGDLFISGKTMSINTGYGELVNAFIAMLEVSRKDEFDQPFSNVSPFLAPYSQSSKELFAEKYHYLDFLMKNYFYCQFRNEGEENLATSFENEFKNLNNQLAKINASSFESLENSTPNQDLDNIRVSVTELIKLFKTDVITNYDLLLGISATDGD
jgi:predicted lipoprotein